MYEDIQEIKNANEDQKDKDDKEEKGRGSKIVPGELLARS